ncbi:MAG TPA: hypothetical protein DDZ76_07580, partial [Xanthomonadales bacterium]|nr:hypothetical protein [Xanthomonadales bacterium]
LSFGIPAFKLEKQVIATRRRVLEEMGVRFHLGTEVDRGLAGELLRDFDAVFLGTGAYLAAVLVDDFDWSYFLTPLVV